MADPSAPQPGSIPEPVKKLFLVLAPLLALILYFVLPDTYTSVSGDELTFAHPAKCCLAVVLWMALWWFTEPVPVAVTALLPAIVYPLCFVDTTANVLAPYASSTIFLFLGGFLIAAAVQRWGLDRRIALTTLRIVGTKANSIVAGLMFATAFISAWVSNTATAAMMAPIAIAVLRLVRTSIGGEMDEREKNFGIAMLLAIAYGASIGGMATIIGSPPNGIYVRFVEQTYVKTVTLLDWMKVGLPIACVLLPVCWFLLVKVLFRNTIDEVKGGAEWVRSELAAMGPLSAGEKAVMAVFVAAVALWSFGGLLRGLSIGQLRPFMALTDSTIAMIAGVMLFCIPLPGGDHVLTWKDCRDIPWDVLLLFGGGLSMAGALQSTNCGAIIAAHAQGLAGLPTFAIMALFSALVILLSNFTSNTALAATMMPILASIAPALGMEPSTPLMVTALSASCAFMMPVGTPPNAIVFATGRITIVQMARTGLVLSIASVAVICAMSTLLL